MPLGLPACVGHQPCVPSAGKNGGRGPGGQLTKTHVRLEKSGFLPVSGALTAFPSPVPCRLSERDESREWSHATDSGQQRRHSLSSRHMALCPLSHPRVNSSHELTCPDPRHPEHPRPPSLPLSSFCTPADMPVLKGRTGEPGDRGPLRSPSPRDLTQALQAPGSTSVCPAPVPWLLMPWKSVHPT